MRLGRLLSLATCVLLWHGAAYADIATVDQTLDYTYNTSQGGSWYFHYPGEVVDHSPFNRHMWEDWGWTHDMSSLVPAGVTGIDSATLTILAWGVNDDIGEVDMVYIDGIAAGPLEGVSNGLPIPPLPPEIYEVPGPFDAYTAWSITQFTLSPQALQQLLLDGSMDVFLNIDTTGDGFRVTIGTSTLTVNYLTGSPVPEPATIGILGLGGLLMARRRRS